MASNLPEPCEKCAPNGGNFRIVVRGEYSGAVRCDCARGMALAAIPPRRVPPPRAEPILTAEEISMAVDGLADNLDFFPKSEVGRIMVGDALALLCVDGVTCLDLVREMLVRYPKWPGVREMRICYCARFGSPLAGEDLGSTVSEYYPDGFNPRIEAPAPRPALPAGRQFSADPELEAVIGTAVQKLPKIADLPKHRPTAAEVRFGEHLQEIVTPPQDRELPQIEKPPLPVEIPPVGPDGRFVGELLGGRITREDVDREVGKLRAGKTTEQRGVA